MEAHFSVKRAVRVVGLLWACEQAGMTPISVRRLHAIAFLANALAPAWGLHAERGAVLKTLGGPFYPDLQEELDHLVGMGVATISGLSHAIDSEMSWRLEASFELRHQASDRIVDALKRWDDEAETLAYLRELCFAASALPTDLLDVAALEDASYSDPSVSNDNVLDLDDEDETENPSVNATAALASLRTTPELVSPSERLHLYVRHIERRLRRGAA